MAPRNLIYRWTVCCALLTLLVSPGCGFVRLKSAKDALMQSNEAYKACLEQHVETPLRCDAAKRALEADINVVKVLQAPFTQSLIVEKEPQ